MVLLVRKACTSAVCFVRLCADVTLVVCPVEVEVPAGIPGSLPAVGLSSGEPRLIAHDDVNAMAVNSVVP